MLSGLLLDAFTSPLGPHDDRALRAVDAIETTWSVQLTHDYNEDWKLVPIDQDRASYLVPDERGHLPFLATPEGAPSATFQALLIPDVLAPGGTPLLHVHVTIPHAPAEHAAAGLEQVAEALRATWAMITPEAAQGVIVQQVVAPDSDDSAPEGLPPLDIPEQLPPDVPQRLGWINYWSAPVATRIGFDGKPGDGIARARRISSGWIAQLTDEPLDLDRADHLDALKHAYARFPAIGRRA